jgi:hypothetical protein
VNDDERKKFPGNGGDAVRGERASSCTAGSCLGYLCETF